ncbi:leucyl/phenylalanyl-tRNA--protein transferase [Roseicyclus mahoneyensis]|nr:leucyl/phenylalanyl-tRNA--protein transferase [Roseicyclus mahoneyensis]
MAHDMFTPARPALTPELMIRAYAAGIFPMSDGAQHDSIFWVDPQRRGVFPLDRFHVSRSLRRRLRQGGFEIAVNRDFAGVVTACADRDETWINADIFSTYMALHALGQAHSVEVWMDGALAGGVFGVTLGAAFFGESMFSRRTDGSKLALVHLVERLRMGGFQLFDTQFTTGHLESLGAIEVPRADYRRQLQMAISSPADFFAPERCADQPSEQRSTQTS